MKKIVLGLAFLGFFSGAQAQEAADKKVQAGLIVGAGMNFAKMGTKKIASGGAGADWTIGANLNYTFNETVGITTGVEFDFSTLKYAAVENAYYRYNDNTILTQDEAADAEGVFLMTSRTQKPIYLTIPVMALFRTSFIGYFRYFGKFGLRSSFLLANTVTDKGFAYTENADGTFPNDPLTNPIAIANNVDATNENMTHSKNDLDFFKSSVGVAGGAEWNFTGSTCLVAELGYYYGFTDIHWDRKDENSSLATSNAGEVDDAPSFFNNAVKQSQLMFKVSILF
ncbi:MAG: outer membrane beta-barrel protein [Flavobacteriales bacterium]|nr:outer membrane beta-barrel protein [Flavobacteriales bacterium]